MIKQMQEIGPWYFDSSGKLTLNQYSWNTFANLLFVDQPVGTGFSYADDIFDVCILFIFTYQDLQYVHNENEVANEMYEFLQVFLKRYPQYVGRPFFITGESYAGHYIPGIPNPRTQLTLLYN